MSVAVIGGFVCGAEELAARGQERCEEPKDCFQQAGGKAVPKVPDTSPCSAQWTGRMAAQL